MENITNGFSKIFAEIFSLANPSIASSNVRVHRAIKELEATLQSQQAQLIEQAITNPDLQKTWDHFKELVQQIPDSDSANKLKDIVTKIATICAPVKITQSTQLIQAHSTRPAQAHSHPAQAHSIGSKLTRCNVLTKAFPRQVEQFLLSTFLDLQSVCALCQTDRNWAKQHTIDNTWLKQGRDPNNSAVMKAFLRKHSPLTFWKCKHSLIEKFGSGILPFLQIFKYDFNLDPAAITFNTRLSTTLKSLATDMPRLQELSLPFIDDAQLDDLNLFTNLQSLDFSNSHTISAIGMAKLSSLISLRSLNFNGCTSPFTDNIAEKLSNLSVLEKLRIKGALISDKALLSLSNTLTFLDVDFCSEISDEGVHSLSRFSALQVLKLGWCHKITEDACGSLSNLTTLQSLDLSSCKITDKVVLGLSRLTALRALNLAYCKEITGENMHHLNTLTSLRSLNLTGCEKLSDKGVSSLVKLISLEELYIQNCYKITNEGMRSLSGLTSLKKFNWYPVLKNAEGISVVW